MTVQTYETSGYHHVDLEWKVFDEGTEDEFSEITNYTVRHCGGTNCLVWGDPCPSQDSPPDIIAAHRRLERETGSDLVSTYSPLDPLVIHGQHHVIGGDGDEMLLIQHGVCQADEWLTLETILDTCLNLRDTRPPAIHVHLTFHNGELDTVILPTNPNQHCAHETKENTQ